MLTLNEVHNIDVLKGLEKLPDNSIDCIVTSPPYWGLRDYKVNNQIGLEEHPQQYIDKIVEIIEECKRILKPTGTIWINLGDSYYSKFGDPKKSNHLDKNKQHRGKFKTNWLQHKQRLLIPYRIAIKCQNDLGLILRNDITWIKQWSNFKDKSSGGNSIPTPVQDRLNTNSEMIFFFVKQKEYFFNLDNVRVPYRDIKNGSNPNGKNPGDCIVFPLESSLEKHSAMFPKTLPEFCIKAGCPENGIVLDPFMGSGTTAIIAKKLNRNFIGFEINKDYIKIIKRRLKELKRNRSL